MNPYGQVFTFAMDEVHRRYVKDVDERSLFEGALAGMLKQLKDDPTVYLSPEETSGINEGPEAGVRRRGDRVRARPGDAAVHHRPGDPRFPGREGRHPPRDRLLEGQGREHQGTQLGPSAGPR